MIKIQKKKFNLEKEISAIKAKHNEIGAVSIFVGYVRNNNNKKKVKSLLLEVYENMATDYLEKITNSAKKKWSLKEILVIHRYGKINIGEKIVLVATFSKHRNKGELACKHIMNLLKKNAPFWKKEYYDKNYEWL